MQIINQSVMQNMQKLGLVTALFGFMAIASFFVGSSVALAENNQPEKPTAPVCAFTADENTVVVDFGNERLRSDQSEDNATGDVVAVSLAAGTYEVSLMAWDGYVNRVNVSQPNESYLVKLAYDGSYVANSSASIDLEDNVVAATFSGVVDTHLELSSDVNEVYAKHAVYPDDSNANSVKAICASFSLIEKEPQPEADEPEAQEPKNEIPVITLLGDNPTEVFQNATYVDAGAIAEDAEDGDITGNIVVGGDTVDTTTLGDYVVTYNVSDSEGATAVEVTRTVTVVEEPIVLTNACPFEVQDERIIIDFPDGEIVMDQGPRYLGPIDVHVPAGTYTVSLASFDGYEDRVNVVQPAEIWKLILKDDTHTVVATSETSDDLIDEVAYAANTTVLENDLVVPVDAVYAKAWHGADEDTETANSVEPVCAALDLVPNEEENQKPVITLTGLEVLQIQVGDNYTDLGATASDPEDGNISDDIVVGGDSVDSDTAGTYVITYDVSDSEGLAADTVSRTVHVVAPEPKACSDGQDNDNDSLVDAEDPGCHTDGDAGNPDSYDPNDDDETHEIGYAPYCGDGVVNQEWESCDAGLSGDNQCTAQCQHANSCVASSFARVNTNELSNYTDGDVTSDVYLGGALNRIPGSAWFVLYHDGAFVTDPDVSGYEDVPGLAVERRDHKIRTVLHGSHPHNGSKEHINGNVELFNTEVVDVLDDTSGNNKLENGFDNVMDTLPGQDEVYLKDDNDTQSFFWLTVTTADDGFFTKYGETNTCDLPNQQPVITLIGDNPLVIDLFSTYTDPGATANDPEDGDITVDIVVGGDTVDPNTEGTYIVTYDVSDSEGLAADQVTRTVSVVGDNGGPDPVCSDGADNDGDLLADEADPACHTDGDAGNPDSYDPNIDSENERPVITLIGDDPTNVLLGSDYTEEGANVNDPEDGNIDGNLVIGGEVVDTNATGTYTVTYNAVDSQGLAALEVTRTVTVVEAINEIPVITLTGNNPIEITVGASYTDPGATANDPEDGDITTDIVVGGDAVDPNTVGSYVVTYNVTDSQGAAAVEVTRTVNVVSAGCTENCGGGGGSNPNPPGGGGGGGGGPIITKLDIFNEKIEVISAGTALITWNTNKPATSRVVYDDDSQSLSASEENFGIGSDDLGYEFSSDIDSELKTEHAMIITNVNLEDLFYFRPLSSDGTRAIGIELNAVLGTVTAESCEQYLFEFIKFGENNNPVEVEKLQVFLNDFEGENLDVNGIYNAATFEAVERFQNKYNEDVLNPWGLPGDTGYVYLTTRKKINEIYCNFQLPFPLTSSQQAEVNAFKAQLEALEAVGQPLPDTSNVGFNTNPTTPTTPVLAVNNDVDETEPTVTLTEEGGEGTEEVEGDETDSLAAALEAVDGDENEDGVLSSIRNFLRGIFR